MPIATSIELRPILDMPVCTVVVPIAITSEPPEQVLHTVREIVHSAMSVGTIQIILWCNATANIGRQTTAQHFRQLLEAAESVGQSSTVGLRLVLDILPNRFSTSAGRVKTIKQVRTNYMEAIISEWHQGKISVDHPVVWFDADTTFIDPTTIPAMLQALNDNQAYFVKGRMVFTGRPDDHRPLARRSQAERVAIIYGAVRSLLEDTLGPYDPREYVDECGLAFKLSTYVAAGGLARSRGTLYGESRVLLGRARQKLKGSTPLVMYISDASHGTLYRRFQTLAQHLAPRMLPEQIGESYFLSSRTIHSDLPAAAIKQSDVMQMIEAMLQQHAVLHGQESLRVIKKEMIDSLLQLVFPEGEADALPSRDTYTLELLRYIAISG